MPANLTDFIRYLADRLPCVVRLAFESEPWGNCKLTVHDQYGNHHVLVVSTHIWGQGDRAWDMVCADLHATILRALGERLMTQWQADKPPGHCVALLQYGDFQRQTTLPLPPPAHTLVDIMRPGPPVLFLLDRYEPLTRVALYRSEG